MDRIFPNLYRFEGTSPRGETLYTFLLVRDEWNVLLPCQDGSVAEHFDEIEKLQAAPEVALVELAVEDHLVDPLQFGKREGRTHQLEGDRPGLGLFHRLGLPYRLGQDMGLSPFWYGKHAT